MSVLRKVLTSNMFAAAILCGSYAILLANSSTATLGSMFGRMMPEALEKLREEAPGSAGKSNGR
jgi:hypothetical protein